LAGVLAGFASGSCGGKPYLARKRSRSVTGITAKRLTPTLLVFWTTKPFGGKGFTRQGLWDEGKPGEEFLNVGAPARCLVPGRLIPLLSIFCTPLHLLWDPKSAAALGGFRTPAGKGAAGEGSKCPGKSGVLESRVWQLKGPFRWGGHSGALLSKGMGPILGVFPGWRGERLKQKYKLSTGAGEHGKSPFVEP